MPVRSRVHRTLDYGIPTEVTHLRPTFVLTMPPLKAHVLVYAFSKSSQHGNAWKCFEATGSKSAGVTKGTGQRGVNCET